MPCLVTTSRDAGKRTISLSENFGRVLLSSLCMLRGKKTISFLVELCRKKGFSRIILINERQGNPNSLQAIKVTESGWDWMFPVIHIKGTKLQGEFGAKPSAQSLKIFDEISVSNLFDLISEDDSILILKATKEKITFFENEREVGPLIKVKSLEHGNRD